MLKKIIKLIQLQYYRLKFRSSNVLFGSGCKVGGTDSNFEGNNRLGRNTVFHGSVGFATYIGSNCAINGKIGRFCSIADDVHTVIGQHPTNTFVSTHPAFFSTKKQAGFTFVKEQLYDESVFADNDGHQIIVGNDVWIGYGAIIFSGVKIGDGAVVAAGAVVTKDVEPYAIVGGIPAKVIKYRFDQDTINFLEEIKWWNKDFEWIKTHTTEFVNIEDFKKLVESGEK